MSISRRWLEQEFKAIKDEVKEVKVEQKSQGETLAVNTAHLAEHMRRTEVLEKRLDSFWGKVLTAVSILAGLLVLIEHLRNVLH